MSFSELQESLLVREILYVPVYLNKSEMIFKKHPFPERQTKKQAQVTSHKHSQAAGRW